MTRNDIRLNVGCPKCGARRTQPCIHTGKRAQKKTREGVLHDERVKAAQRQEQRRKRGGADVGDTLFYDLTPEEAAARGPA